MLRETPDTCWICRNKNRIQTARVKIFAGTTRASAETIHRASCVRARASVAGWLTRRMKKLAKGNRQQCSVEQKQSYESCFTVHLDTKSVLKDSALSVSLGVFAVLSTTSSEYFMAFPIRHSAPFVIGTNRNAMFLHAGHTACERRTKRRESSSNSASHCKRNSRTRECTAQQID